MKPHSGLKQDVKRGLILILFCVHTQRQTIVSPRMETNHLKKQGKQTQKEEDQNQGISKRIVEKDN
jgi:hypothetical protein